MATVAIAHTNEQRLSMEKVEALLKEALDHLGGMSKFVMPGDTVLLKPNQRVFYSAEEGGATDPLVVGALIRLARQAGASRVQVAESSLGFLSSLDSMRVTGMAAVAEREGAELIDLGSDDVPSRIVPILDGFAIREAPLPVPLLDANVVIDIPKAKTDPIDPIAGALENWVGVVNQSWRQRNYGDGDTIERFVDIMSVSKPNLCVVDALIVASGWCGCVLASADPVATDVAIARLMGRNWEELRYAKAAERRGLGVRQPIQYAGVPLSEVALSAPARGPDGYGHLPVTLLVGRGVTLEGTIGHVMSALGAMHARGELAQVSGVPTIMIGEADDPQFEEHLRQGPYVVFDDAAKPVYKNHPRVHFVPGHPVLGAALPELFEGLKLRGGKAMTQWRRAERKAIRPGHVPDRRKVMLVAKPLAALGATAAFFFALTRRFIK